MFTIPHSNTCRLFIMADIRASDLPGSWRFLLYVGALCGCSNVYRFSWIQRWLRRLSIVYQIIMLAIYFILIGVALADPGPSCSLNLAINRYALLLQYTVIMLSSIVILWQTGFGSGLFVLFQTWKAFQASNSYVVKHKLWRVIIILAGGLFIMMIHFMIVTYVLWEFAKYGRFPGAPDIFPILGDHTTRDLVFGVDAMFRGFGMTFICSNVLLCFVVVVDLTFLFRTLREEMGGVFSLPTVGEWAVERCLRSLRGICELVNVTNGTFGKSLAIYLMWIILTIINIGIQLVQWQDKNLMRLLMLFTFAIETLIIILVPPAVMAAQVNAISKIVEDCIYH